MTWHTLTGRDAVFPRYGQRVVVRVGGKEREAVFTWTPRNYRFDPPGRRLTHVLQVEAWREDDGTYQAGAEAAWATAG